MGIIDSKTITLNCKHCGTDENQKVVEHGSNYGSSGWGDLGPYKLFNVTVKKTNFGPEVESATCKSCGSVADITNQ